jgi:hypothetical protein
VRSPTHPPVIYWVPNHFLYLKHDEFRVVSGWRTLEQGLAAHSNDAAVGFWGHPRLRR